MDDAFAEVVRMGGLETENDYSYDGRREECHFEESKVKVYINGSLDISEDETEIAEALLEHGPLAIALNAAWMQFYHGGVSHPIRNEFYFLWLTGDLPLLKVFKIQKANCAIQTASIMASF